MTRKYPIIYVRFWDHCHGAGLTYHQRAPLQCEVYGALYHEDDLAIYVASWVTAGEPEDDNTEWFTILKSAIVEKKVLRAKKRK